MLADYFTFTPAFMTASQFGGNVTKRGVGKVILVCCRLVNIESGAFACALQVYVSLSIICI